MEGRIWKGGSTNKELDGMRPKLGAGGEELDLSVPTWSLAPLPDVLKLGLHRATFVSLADPADPGR